MDNTELVVVLCAVFVVILEQQQQRKRKRSDDFSERADDMYKELMNSADPNRFTTETRMERQTFDYLLNLLEKQGGLKSGYRVCAGLKLVLLIEVLMGQSEAAIASKWNLSSSTVCKAIDETLNSFHKLEPTLFYHPPLDYPPDIKDSPNFFPYFDGCIGVIDCTHISAFVSDMRPAWKNLKNFISQNVLVVVNFDMTITFCVTGWEGCAEDDQVLEDAWTKGLTTPPAGQYYLADAGFGQHPSVLTPYRDTRYRLKDWYTAVREGQLPSSPRELFNFRHSMLRNVVERTIGVVKKRFDILNKMHSFSLQKQQRLVFTAFMIHNAIRRTQSAEDIEFDVLDDLDYAEAAEYATDDVVPEVEDPIRDRIAQRLWDDMQAHPVPSALHNEDIIPS